MWERVIRRQGKTLLALQHGNLRQFTGLFSQVAANCTDRPRQLIAGMQLLISQCALEHFAVAAAQGQQNPAIGAWRSGDVEVGEQGGKFFLDQAHVFQLRMHLNGKHAKEVASIVPAFENKKSFINQ